MRKAMSKKVGAGGRFDIFLGSEDKRNMSDFLTNFLANMTILGPHRHIPAAKDRSSCI